MGRPLELINKQGILVKRIDHVAEEKARIAKEAEAEKRRELDSAQRDAARRNQALLATYTSEKDIEESRTRELREHQRQVQEVSGGSGFCAQNQRRLHFGLGPGAAVEKAVVRWPSGKIEELQAPVKNRVHKRKEPA